MFTIKRFIDFMSNGKELIYIKITWFRTGLVEETYLFAMKISN